ncbi:MAG: peroxiredoxin family protein [Actinomycetota bacterium]
MTRALWMASALLTLVALAPAQTEPVVGKPAAAFELPQLNGKRLHLKALKGKVVLLNFWDFGCPSCNLEVKHLQRLHTKYQGKGLRVIGIAELEPDPEKVKQFLEQYEATYTVVLDANQAVGKKYQVTAHPTTVILDRSGVIRFAHTGFLKGDEKMLEEAVQAVLAGQKLASR